MLIVKPNLSRPDETYAALIAAHDGLTDEESSAFDARLILLLMNHIGDDAMIADALRIAGETAGSGGKSSPLQV